MPASGRPGSSLCRLVAVLEQQVYVYELDTLEHLATLATPANPQVRKSLLYIPSYPFRIL